MKTVESPEIKLVQVKWFDFSKVSNKKKKNEATSTILYQGSFQTGRCQTKILRTMKMTGGACWCSKNNRKLVIVVRPADVVRSQSAVTGSSRGCDTQLI